MSRVVPILVAASLLSTSALAASFAQRVVSYTPGAGVGVYSNPAAALGAPSPVTDDNAAAAPFFGFGNVLSPFSPAFQNDEIVRLGEGGSITLQLERYINVGAGPEFGLIENISLLDPSYPSGTTTNPAVTFGDDRALVEVSQDGVNFLGLNGGAATDTLFNLPAVYFLNAGAFDTTAPASPVIADFGKPFTGTLASFDGKSSYAEVLAVLNGSAGGTWLDVTGLSSIGYIRLSVPDDGDSSTVNTLEVDSILSNSALLGSVVPEPASIALLGFGLLPRRRR